jgi:hypothetical protein
MPYNSEFGGLVVTEPFVPGLSGGDNNRVVRLSSSANVMQNADNTDTAAQLFPLLFKDGNGTYLRAGAIVETLTGLTVGSVYYLGSSGQLTTTPPTPGPGVRYVALGKALDVGRFLFQPSIIVGG